MRLGNLVFDREWRVDSILQSLEYILTYSPGFVAKRLCPDLILLPINFARYSEMSKKVMDIFRQYDPNMLVAGCDEGYLK